VVNYASTTAPTGGYLPCDGSIYSRSTYTALADVIGTPPMLSSYTAEYSNSNAQWLSSQIAVANGVAFISNTITTGSLSYESAPRGQYSGGLYTSTDGSTWTPRTARRLHFDTTILNGAVAANASGGVWMLANTGGAGTNFQTSTDLATWTNRTITFGGNQAGLPTTVQGVGIAGKQQHLVGLLVVEQAIDL
jgi:hypothetical protein